MFKDEAGRGICEQVGASVRWRGRMRMAVIAAATMLPLTGVLVGGIALRSYNKIDDLGTKLDRALAFIDADKDAEGHRDVRVNGLALSVQDLTLRTAKVEGRVGNDETQLRCILAKVRCAWPD